ncbi:hypothetical protein GCM10007276_02860 [Agaricicola taiwanensis]|uniref:Enoyl-CoA hydratase/isomerase family protein n=1 Tax=Agaricicola taiwanensis TaxID=591372 RepID=A0A8J2YEQ8_9RHOB|nr:enoyl-CoA hydratase/isomerase family protein [Agaricicola taiwanensis]GGE29143.1 hypothetical protein GCM10007276_02860 [Agaricicola taiwanensis]
MLQREMHGEVLVLRLNRPEKLNAWNLDLRNAVKDALIQADGDSAVKAVIVTGTGSRAFCAGADLSDKAIGVASEAGQRMVAFRALYDSIQSFRKPLIAALNGLAMGSAFQAILLMDYRIGHAGVTVGMPEINSGMPCITGSAILNWSIGAPRALNIASTGRFLGSDEALHLGLINEIVDEDQVLPRALELAAELMKKSPQAYAETKLWFRDMTRPALDAAFARAAEVRAKSEMAQSIEAGVGAFLTRGSG